MTIGSQQYAMNVVCCGMVIGRRVVVRQCIRCGMVRCMVIV